MSLDVISVLLQDWTTLHATNATSSFTQSESSWIDASGFRDFSGWIQVSEATQAASISVALESAPTPDPALFQAVTSTAISAAGVFVVVSRANLANVPLARFLRWTVSKAAASSDWGITFRILLAMNPVESEYRLSFGQPLLARLSLDGGRILDVVPRGESERRPTDAHRIAPNDIPRARS